MRNFCNDNVTYTQLTLLLRTTIKAELKHKTEPKAVLWKYWKATKVTRSMGLRFSREGTCIVNPKSVTALTPASICLYSIWGLDTKTKWCPRAWGSLLGRGDKNLRTRLLRRSEKVSWKLMWFLLVRLLPVTNGCMCWARGSETQQREEAKRLIPKDRRLLPRCRTYPTVRNICKSWRKYVNTICSCWMALILARREAQEVILTLTRLSPWQ